MNEDELELQDLGQDEPGLTAEDINDLLDEEG
jgi:hypothetical protein